MNGEPQSPLSKDSIASSDIVQKLRDICRGLAVCDPIGIACSRAADEIECLRSAVSYALNFDGEIPELIRLKFLAALKTMPPQVEKCHRNGEYALCWRVRCNLNKHCVLCEVCRGTKKAMARVQYRDGRACTMEERPCPL